MPRWGHTSFDLLKKLISRETDECIIWPLSLRGKGYPQVRDKRYGCQRGGHVIAWELSTGKSASNYIMHSCDEMRCVNPRHLSQGTPRENNRDMFAKGRGKMPPKNPRDPITGRWTSL